MSETAEKPRVEKKRYPRPNRQKPAAIRHKGTLLERIAEGEYVTDIAKDLGLTTPAAVSKYLSHDPDYIAARLSGTKVRLEKWERELEAADDNVKVARARELLSHARWRAEREFPEHWGQHNRLTVEHSGDLGDRLRRAKERVIDGAAQVVSEDAPQQNSLSLNNQGEVG